MENKPVVAIEPRGEHLEGGDRQALLAVAGKVAWRLMPIIMICYMFAFFDRIIISFAKFQFKLTWRSAIQHTASAPGCSPSATSCSKFQATCFFIGSAPGDGLPAS